MKEETILNTTPIPREIPADIRDKWVELTTKFNTLKDENASQKELRVAQNAIQDFITSITDDEIKANFQRVYNTWFNSIVTDWNESQSNAEKISEDKNEFTQEQFRQLIQNIVEDIFSTRDWDKLPDSIKNYFEKDEGKEITDNLANDVLKNLRREDISRIVNAYYDERSGYENALHILRVVKEMIENGEMQLKYS
jgi:hypothetical protein